MKSLSLQYVSEIIDKSTGTKRGKTATVSFVTIQGHKFAFKKYRSNAIVDLPAMENHICNLFDNLSETNYKEMMIVGAFPKYLVYDGYNFCGFLMDRIPDDCYLDDKTDRHLGSFYGIDGEIYQYSDKQIGNFLKKLGLLIWDFHERGYVFGDVLNDQNIYIRVINGELYPYIVDTDSFCIDQKNPAKTYHSPNFEPPEGEDSPPSKESDIYKYCLIALRMFAKPEVEYERAGLLIEDDEADNSLRRIKDTLGENYKSAVIRGFSQHPVRRPSISEILNTFKAYSRNNTVKARKPTPNNPCPCGSGKKYKDCCGKVKISRNTISKQVTLNNPCPCGSGKKYKNCCRKKNLSGDTSRTQSNSALSSKTDYKQSSRLNKNKSTNDKSLLDKVKRVIVSVVFNLIAAILMILVMVTSRFDVFGNHGLYFFVGLSLASVLIYYFIGDLCFDEEYGEWTNYDSILVVFLVLLAVNSWILPNSNWDSIITVAFISVFIVLVLTLTTARSLQFLNEKSALEQQQVKTLRTSSIFTYSILSVMLIIGTVHQFKTLNPINVGDTITLGAYEQDGDLTNGNEGIQWTVHDIKDGKALLLCDRCIEALPFNKDGLDNSWTNSDVRKWLNGEFFDSAFSNEEKAIIAESNIVTSRLKEDGWGETYGEDEMTTDRIFAPNLSEFSEITSELNISEIAKDHYISNTPSWGQDHYEAMFWIRCPHGESNNFAYGYQFDAEGEGDMYFVLSPDTYALIRPAMYIDVGSYSH